MLVHKGGQINNVQLITGLRIAEMSQLQNCSVMCTKNGSYCENEKKERTSKFREFMSPAKNLFLRNKESSENVKFIGVTLTRYILSTYADSNNA